MSERKVLEHLYSYEYEHPFDRESLDRLEKTRGLELLTEKVLDYGLEKYHLIKHTADNIKITQDNIPEIYNILVEACRILGMKDVPELYLHLEDKITSFTSGDRKKIIILSSGAIDLLNDDELLFVMGRELGHIRSNHVLYRMMADSLQVITQLISDVTLGLGNLLSMPLQIALMHWYRMSEFTADRAGLLTCQDPDVAANAFIKIAGLPLKYHGRITPEDFRKQAHEFDHIQATNFDKLIRFVAGYENPHPFTIIRASQMFQWVDDGTYDRLLNRESKALADNAIKPVCKSCAKPFSPDEYYCTRCGKPVQ